MYTQSLEVERFPTEQFLDVDPLMRRHTTNAVIKAFPIVKVQGKLTGGKIRTFMLEWQKSYILQSWKEPASATDLNELPEVVRLKKGN